MCMYAHMQILEQVAQEILRALFLCLSLLLSAVWCGVLHCEKGREICLNITGYIYTYKCMRFLMYVCIRKNVRIHLRNGARYAF